ncbi:MAG: hypothetical protein KJ077_42770 [Anaerolineae bacterium]|nr:hypothetical protein [Anaerolineae bacterium]
MATPRKPWPAWAEGDYHSLRRQIRRIHQMAEKAREVQHRNVYLTGDLLSRLAGAGQQITNTARKLELEKGGERWPNWAKDAVTSAKKSGKYISAGARHGLAGLNEDNWKKVLLGLDTCIEHAGKVETALLEGPPPAGELERAVEAILRTARFNG